VRARLLYLQIWVLRDIIGELESQVETKTQHEAALEQQLHELHAILEQQSKTHQELAEEVSDNFCVLCLFFAVCQSVCITICISSSRPCNKY
jgi:CO dehydrogenase/acetyl-CoA synthase beta subunit